MLIKPDKNKIRLKRHMRVQVSGTAARPRLSVFRSLKHIYAQVIDDDKGITLAAASSLDKDFQGSGSNIAAAKLVGKAIANKALAKGITQVVFDRAGYIYHGRVAALAQAARNGRLYFLTKEVEAYAP